LHPIQHRSREVRQDLVVLRARDALVAARTELINATRGLGKSMGTRLPKCSSPRFAEKVEGAVPTELRDARLPLVRMTAALSDCIQEYDKKIEKLGREKYEHTALLRQVKVGRTDHGVGLRTDLRESGPIREESRCGAISGISTEAGGFRGDPAAIRN
jgi:transposase